MYEVVNTGEKITGEVMSRLSNTMVVVGPDGYTYLCKLVGTPDKRPDFTLEGVKRNFNGSAPRKKVKVVESNGKIKQFDSVGGTAKHYNIDRKTVSLGCDTGKVTTRGKVEGFLFSWT